MDLIKGRAFLLNDNVDTDQILPGYAMSYPTDDLKKVTLKGSVIPNFPEEVRQGDIVIAGDNFGCGSSREQAPVALKSSGVGAVIAKSFARIFRRNSINIGLPVVECDFINDIMNESNDNDEFEIDIENCLITNLRTNKKYRLNKLSDTALETIKAGGLVNKVKKVLYEGGKING